MPFTRAQASELLNKSEMKLFDESRANALRGFDRAALASRIARTRAARDRARDLLKRQRLAARKRGDGKSDDIAARTARKEALLVEVLGRFVEGRRLAPDKARKPAAKKAQASPAAKSADTSPASTKQATTKQATSKQATSKQATSKQATSKQATKKQAGKQAAASGESAGKVATKHASKTASSRATDAGTTAPARSTRKAPRKLSPERALENTRSLLEAKQERDRSPQAWQALDPAGTHVPQPGYQSGQAASQAQALHEAEARIPGIQGSSSARDRYNQGKRDHRGDTD